MLVHRTHSNGFFPRGGLTSVAIIMLASTGIYPALCFRLDGFNLTRLAYKVYLTNLFGCPFDGGNSNDIAPNSPDFLTAAISFFCFFFSSTTPLS